MLFRMLMLTAALCSAFCASYTTTLAAGPVIPKVAVTDLCYEERVREYFREVSAHSKTSLNERYRDRERETPSTYSTSTSGSVRFNAESDYHESSGTYSYIERGELRKFVADIKGAMLKSGAYRIIQGKPSSNKNLENLFDITKRIKDGDFQGADFVLFGTVSSIEFRNEVTPIQGSNNDSHIFSLELVADFSLINTKTMEVKAAFSAMGEGQEVKLLSTSRGGRIQPNRGRIIADVSQSLGLDTAMKLDEQFQNLR